MRYAPMLLFSAVFVTGALGMVVPAQADFMNDAQRFFNQGNQGSQSDRNAYEQGRRDEMQRQQIEREQRRADRERRQDYNRPNHYSDRYDPNDHYDRYNDRRY